MADQPTYEELMQQIRVLKAAAVQHEETVKALKDREKRYRLLVEESFDGIFIQKGPTIIFANQQLHHMLGYDVAELLGMDHWRVYHPEYREVTRRRAQARMRGEKVPTHYEVKLNRKDGSWFYGEIGARAIDVEGEPGVQVWVRDIHERKLAEEALRKSEQKYKAILDNIQEGYYEVDIEGNFTFFNRSMCEILGYPPDEMMGMNNRQYTDKKFAKRVYSTFNQVYTTGAPAKGFDWELIRKDGSVRIVETSVTLIRDFENRPVGFRGIARDVTREKRLEAQIQRAEKMETIGTLAGGVAHDLNNILSGLVSYPELLLLQLPEESPLRKPIETIQKSGEKAAAVVQDLLTLARRGVVVTEPVNLNDLIREYLHSPEYARVREFHPGVETEIRLEDTLLNIPGSPTHLSKTLANLISNAAEAMPAGGRIVLRTENRYIDAPLSGYDDVREGDYVVFSISDTGTGISSEDIEKIFEPFYTKKKMGRSGTGLGMAVVWGTVKDHNGYIDVKSAEGDGTTFRLYFPATREVLPETRAKVPVTSYRGKGESILVVDDVAQQRELAAEMLEQLGYRVEVVSSGEEAVEYLKNHQMDLLVLDMIMDPGWDGLDTYRKILEIHPGQKAVIASGFSESARVKEAQRLGTGSYIKKPFLMETLGMAVRRELER